MQVTFPEKMDKKKKNDQMCSMHELFKKIPTSLGFAGGSYVDPSVTSVEIEIDAKESEAIKIAYKKRDEIRKIFDGTPAKIIINL